MSCISDRGMQGLDRWITDGNSHKCVFCGETWWDCERGCSNCYPCKSCGKPVLVDDLNDDGICDFCFNTSCMWCGDARGAVDINLGTGETFCPDCYGYWLRGEL